MSINIRRDFYNLVKKSEYGSYKKIVDQINRLKFDSLDNIGFLNKSHELKGKILDNTSIDGIIIEAFALAKEVVKRALGLTPYDEQLIAGIAMHKGKLIEMQTGEGKTLAAVFPAFLNALTGRGCHILTFNDYLARRDATWMGPVYEMLGLTVGFVQETMERHEKQRAYACDITYVTAKVAGFDYGVKLSILQRKNPLQEFQLETASVFQNLQQEIQKRILQDFEALDLSNQGLISLKGRIKPPSSTWTYLVNDNSLIDPLSSLFIRNAIASIGILTALPIRFGTWIFKKIF
ncbi:hypothetical protein [Clostridium tagluense]|uniref:hypothetical protein n=1 Tax=Clostridium tagluense TaxID=360422 RepID=UPI001C0B9BA1|nr:hypothetical protein [Clostridium tagluense]MBU3126356.1 hypothetical protein [Clostridium tagluense]